MGKSLITEAGANQLGKMFIEEVMPEEDKVIMAFGMIPNESFQPFMKMILDGAVDRLNDHYGTDGLITIETLEKGVVEATEELVAKAVYRHADMVV